MSRSILGFAALFLISLPCAAMADVYPGIPVPAPPGVTPQRLSPRQVFHWLDTNHDGFLTLNEFLAAPWVQNRQQATRFFYWMDTNRDGLVSLPEFLAAYSHYSGNNGYSVQVAYPWAWVCWRPWQYGWYWQSGWHRRPGVWPEYASGPHHVVKHVGPVKHVGSVKHFHPVAEPVKHAYSVAKPVKQAHSVAKPVKHAHSVAKPHKPTHSGNQKGHAHQGHHR